MQTLEFLTETPNMTAAHAFTLSSDLINELLRGMRLRGVQYRRIQAGPSFGMGFDAKPGHAYFHFLAAGHATLRGEDGNLFELSAGNAVFIAHGGAHALLSDASAGVHDIGDFDSAPLGDAVCAVDASPNATPSTLLFSACMEFELGSIQGLGNLMPALMLIDAGGQRYPGLMPILAVMEREVSTARIGFAGILARLADVVAAMIVRGWVECACGNASGLVAALRDPRLARALLALHQQPGRDWSVAELAAHCHTSRSVFADRFQATLGIPPLRYATELRMRLATQWLSLERMPIETVAQRLGYTSQAAFSRAFKRITGQPPGAARSSM
ncbi:MULTISPECIES: AraC family transcriptional regulator [Pseudomonas]|uniref:AraC family transcriptional regulator n=1 Tax=Pseudomonas TaxID=286 RepID=UPI001C0A854A|nr:MULTISPECIES: AraC family transcriptional regulator [Pseudomonas]MCK3841600.1 AraC family transcriptional regulator [Pseudomonas sp. NCIMB 10586]MCK3844964.1 AraC family transcriptional regulator [Pseudomonas sp. W15Feb34]MCK3865323.1 AraC family transcriptional regulator [Pseudomonas sp. B329]VCU63823.1 AraC family transcriptional regulator [Pseudomonas synxantha]